MEFVNGDGQGDRVSDASVATAGIRVDLFGEGLQNDGVHTSRHPVRHVHQNVKGLVGARREFLKVLSGDVDVPDDVNAEGIRHTSEAEVKPVGTVSFVAHGDGQGDLIARVHVHRRAHSRIDACIKIEHVLDVGGEDG